MSTVPVDKSVGKILILAKYPTILEKVTHWLKNRHFIKLLLLNNNYYLSDTFLAQLTESLLKDQRSRSSGKVYFCWKYLVLFYLTEKVKFFTQPQEHLVFSKLNVGRHPDK